MNDYHENNFENAGDHSRVFNGEITGSENREQVFSSQPTSYTVYPQNQPDPYSQPSPSFSSDSKKPKKGKGIFRVVALACVFGLVAGAAFQGVNWLGNTLSDNGSSFGNSSPSPAVIYTASGGNSETVYDVSAVTEAVMPAMVSINVVATKTMQNNFGGFFGNYGNYEYQTQGSGSGIIISNTDTELLMVTNNHVVEDATEISVTFIDGNSYAATIKGTDADFDLAVISIDKSAIPEETMEKIKVAVLGDSTAVKLGEPAIAIGNALGFGQAVTVGHISVLSREVQLTDNTMNLIQTDAAINPGNSGGALLNMKGEVIGINSVKYASTEVEGIGYAIPISDAIPIISDLIDNVTVPEDQQGYLGIKGTDISSAYQQSFGWPKGIYVSSVTPGSPAALAGMRAQDIIVRFDGRETLTMDSLKARLERKSVGDQVEVAVQRQNPDGTFEEVLLSVTLAAKPQETR